MEISEITVSTDTIPFLTSKWRQQLIPEVSPKTRDCIRGYFENLNFSGLIYCFEIYFGV